MPEASRRRVQRRPVHGVVLLDKPLGLSSNQALQKVRWLLRAQKGGHTGTLDPMATGVLPLALGAATKFSNLHLQASKRYEALIELGVTTSTGDREGQVTGRCPPPELDDRQLRELAQRFTGRIEQIPPMHSALKKDGQPLYAYARRGQSVEREARPVNIHALELSQAASGPAGSILRMRVHCGPGTYVRTLAEDIGRALGCGAHLQALRRTAAGDFSDSQCITIAQLEQMPDALRLDCVLPVETLLQGLPTIRLPETDAGPFLCGARIRCTRADAPLLAVFGTRPDALLGTGCIKAGELIARRLLNPQQIREILSAPADSPQLAHP